MVVMCWPNHSNKSMCSRYQLVSVSVLVRRAIDAEAYDANKCFQLSHLFSSLTLTQVGHSKWSVDSGGRNRRMMMHLIFKHETS